MAQEPYNSVPTVLPQGDLGGPMQINAPLSAFGGVQAEGLQKSGASLEDAGKQLFDVYKEQRDKAYEVDNNQKGLALSAALSKTESEFYALKGLDAYNQRGAFQDQMHQQYEQLASTLSPIQRQMFDRANQSKLEGAFYRMGSRAGEQLQQADVTTKAAMMQNSIAAVGNDPTNNWSTPEGAAKTVAVMEDHANPDGVVNNAIKYNQAIGLAPTAPDGSVTYLSHLSAGVAGMVQNQFSGYMAAGTAAQNNNDLAGAQANFAKAQAVLTNAANATWSIPDGNGNKVHVLSQQEQSALANLSIHASNAMHTANQQQEMADARQNFSAIGSDTVSHAGYNFPAGMAYIEKKYADNPEMMSLATQAYHAQIEQHTIDARQNFSAIGSDTVLHAGYNLPAGMAYIENKYAANPEMVSLATQAYHAQIEQHTIDARQNFSAIGSDTVSHAGYNLPAGLAYIENKYADNTEMRSLATQAYHAQIEQHNTDAAVSQSLYEKQKSGITGALAEGIPVSPSQMPNLPTVRNAAELAAYSSEYAVLTRIVAETSNLDKMSLPAANQALFALRPQPGDTDPTSMAVYHAASNFVAKKQQNFNADPVSSLGNDPEYASAAAQVQTALKNSNGAVTPEVVAAQKNADTVVYQKTVENAYGGPDSVKGARVTVDYLSRADVAQIGQMLHPAGEQPPQVDAFAAKMQQLKTLHPANYNDIIRQLQDDPKGLNGNLSVIAALDLPPQVSGMALKELIGGGKEGKGAPVLTVPDTDIKTSVYADPDTQKRYNALSGLAGNKAAEGYLAAQTALTKGYLRNGMALDEAVKTAAKDSVGGYYSPPNSMAYTDARNQATAFVSVNAAREAIMAGTDKGGTYTAEGDRQARLTQATGYAAQGLSGASRPINIDIPADMSGSNKAKATYLKEVGLSGREANVPAYEFQKDGGATHGQLGDWGLKDRHGNFVREIAPDGTSRILLINPAGGIR